MLNGVYDNSLFSSYENALLDFGMSPLGFVLWDTNVAF